MAWRTKMTESGYTEFLEPWSGLAKNIGQIGSLMDALTKAVLPISDESSFVRNGDTRGRSIEGFNSVEVHCMYFRSFPDKMKSVFTTFNDIVIEDKDIKFYPINISKTKIFLLSCIFAYESSVSGNSVDEHLWYSLDAKCMVTNILGIDLIVLSCYNIGEKKGRQARNLNGLISSTLHYMGFHIDTHLPVNIDNKSGIESTAK